MNKIKKTFTGILAAAMAMSTAMTAYAATEHWNDASTVDPAKWAEWKQQWEAIKNDYEQVSLTPGADETKLNPPIMLALQATLCLTGFAFTQNFMGCPAAGLTTN